MFCGLFFHMRCLGVLSGIRVSHWATVPSLPAKMEEHPLHALASPMMANLPEVTLTAAADVPEHRRRLFCPDHYRAGSQVPSGAHVLVIDDTWTSGGHAQSVALAVRKAGAEKVSILNLARYFKEGYGDNAKFVAKYLTRDYDPLICPWTTDGSCPEESPF
jgi:orotate phosphoribosyltransferase